MGELSLRDYQGEVVDFLLPRERAFAVAPAGSGKTIMAATAVGRKVRPGQHVVWLANTREQVEQGIAAIQRVPGPEDVTFDVCCVAAEPESISRADIVVVDECFPGTVEVDGRPICDIRTGDSVRCYDHCSESVVLREVRSVFSREHAGDWCRVHFSDGKTFICTEGHPVYIRQLGYVPAKRLSMVLAADTLGTYEGFTVSPSAPLPALRDACDVSESRIHELADIHGRPSCRPHFLQSDLSQGLVVAPVVVPNDGDELPTSRNNLGADENTQPHANALRARTYASNDVGARSLGWGAWREWSAYARAAAIADGRLGSAARTRYRNSGRQAPRANVGQPAELLQSRSGSDRGEGCSRNRWRLPQGSDGALARREKDRGVERVRVVRVEVYKRGSPQRPAWVPGSDTVYNLHVAEHENYFAEGCLVHNCHHAPAATWDALLSRVKPGATVWGFSATPWSPDRERNDRLEELFQEFITIDRARVEASGHLMKGKVYFHDLDVPGQFDPEIDARVAVEVEKRFRQFPILWDIPKVKGLTSSIKATAAAIKRMVPADTFAKAGRGELSIEGLRNLGIYELVEKAAALSKERDELVKKEHEKRAKWQITQEFLQANEARNAAIVSLITQEVAQGESVLCLVSSIDHGEQLAARVPEARLAHSKLPAKARRETIAAFRDGSLRVLFATSLADEGLDVPRASRLVLAAGGRSAAKLEQRAGRVLRPFEGKSGGVIHDFLDAGALFAKAQARARIRVYESLGYEPEVVSYRADEVKKAA